MEHDPPPRELEPAVHPAQKVLPLADEDVGLRLDAVAIDEEPALDRDFSRTSTRPRRSPGFGLGIIIVILRAAAVALGSRLTIAPHRSVRKRRQPIEGIAAGRGCLRGSRL